jgi:serine/threonine protein kinase
MERIVAHREHPAPSLRKACPAAPPWLDRIFRKMVAKKPEDRYQSATAMISDLVRRSAPRKWRWLWLPLLVVMAMVLVETLETGISLLLPVHRGVTPASQKEREPTKLPAKPHETLPEQPKKENPLDLPVKPTWRMTGEYPLIAGVWSIVENKGTLVTIIQHGGDFVATASYKSGDETVTWRAEGRISRSGHITMSFVHTQPHPPDKWLPQTRTAVLGLHGKALEGYAYYEGGGHKFTWRLVEPRPAEERELSQ